jgi:hypothetical protein
MLDDSLYPRSPKKKNEEEEAAVPPTPRSPKATKPAWLVLEEKRDRDLAIAVTQQNNAKAAARKHAQEASRKHAQEALKTINAILLEGNPLTIAKALLSRDAAKHLYLSRQWPASGGEKVQKAWFELVTMCAQMIVNGAEDTTQQELFQCLNTLLAFAHLPHAFHLVPQVLKMLLERALASPTPAYDPTFLQKLQVIAALHNPGVELVLNTLYSKYILPNGSDLWKENLPQDALIALETWEGFLGTACLLHSHAQACILRSDDTHSDAQRAVAIHRCLWMLIKVAHELEHPWE